jgi:hypothetical protein
VSATASQAIASARYEPGGRRLTLTMKPIVARNFSRASAAWTRLSRAT